jgi:hypothetical protein
VQALDWMALPRINTVVRSKAILFICICFDVIEFLRNKYNLIFVTFASGNTPNYMTRNKWYLKFAALLVIPAMVLLFHNRVSNWHYHVLYNGIVVEHSHPFSDSKKDGSPFQNHQHSDSEFLMLAELSNALTLLVVALMVAGLLLEKTTRQTTRPRIIFLSEQGSAANPLRAPPNISA